MLFNRMGLIALVAVAMTLTACSENKWQLNAKNATNLKMKVNSTEIVSMASAQVGSPKNGDVVELKTAFEVNGSYVDGPTFTAKPTAKPSSDGDDLDLTFTFITQDTTTKLNVSTTSNSVELKVKE